MQTRDERTTMAPVERRAALSLAAIFSMRMLGLFMIMPVISLYGQELRGATPALIGLALGAYGFTQALLQIPFGLLSDRFGRKRIIAIGLVLFALGSVLAAVSTDIWGVILGRALQGGGAIAAAVMALAADLTREEHRTKAMAMIGMSIGLAFSLALVAAPWAASHMGLAGIFWLTAGMAVLGLGVLYGFVPTPHISRVHRDAQPVPAQFMQALRDPQLLRLDFGILSLHMILTATFVSLPLVLHDALGLAVDRHPWIYLPVLLASVVVMVPFIIQAEKHRRMKPVFVGSIVVIAVAELLLSQVLESLTGVVLGLFVFFVGFNILEATLPSLISKVAPPDSKGTAMGFYSSSQFFGAFLGGLIGGSLQGIHGNQGVFVFCAAAALLWVGVAATMRSPRYLSSRLIGLGPVAPEQAPGLVRRFTQIRGVAEAVVIADEGVAYLKVDPHALDEPALDALVGELAPGSA